MDRIEIRHREHGGADTRVVIDLQRDPVTLDVTTNGDRASRTADRERVLALAARFDALLVPAVPAAQSWGGAAEGYEVTVASSMTQSSFRWVGSAPSAWEGIAAVARDLLAVARETPPSAP